MLGLPSSYGLSDKTFKKNFSQVWALDNSLYRPHVPVKLSFVCNMLEQAVCPGGLKKEVDGCVVQLGEKLVEHFAKGNFPTELFFPSAFIFGEGL